MTPPGLKYSFLVVAAILLIAPRSALGQRFIGPITTSQVKFERGRTRAVIKGIAKTPGTHEYVLRVRSGQTMTVHLTSSNKGVEFSVETPTGEWVDDALGVTAWSGQLEFSGEYKLLLTNNRSKSQKEQTYTLEIMVTGHERTSNGSSVIGRARSPWPRNKGVYIATSSETTPLFPRALSGYRPEEDNKDFWGHTFACKGSIRVFEGGGWSGVPDFPATMSGCSHGVFTIRWRSGLAIESALGFHELTLSSGPKTGAFGYMHGTNCEQPIFRFVTTVGNASNLTDVFYELKFCQAAP